ncbi:MAG: protein-export chaperone SecB [Alphaproteobacteria bacterium]|nr:protein-export chaperone SecB [Alphaproteobacteria bacterium]
MSDTPANGNGSTPDNQAAAGPAAQIQVLAQYVKDLSFENPGAPMSLQGQKPALEVGVDVQARGLGVDQYEVSIRVRADAKAANQTVFVCEVTYAGVFMLKNIGQENVQPILLIECPRQLFPFARRVVADTTRDGGFPPLMLDPIDFLTLYRAQLAQAQKAQGAQASA